MKKPVVFYHRDCDDGFGAAFSFWKKHGYSFEYVGVKHDEPFDVGSCENRDVYVVDFSFPKTTWRQIRERATKLVMLDHHLTAFETYAYEEREHFQETHRNGDTGEVYYDILLDNNRSGASISWTYVHHEEPPLFIRHIEDNDLWKHSIPDTREFIAALRSYPQTFEKWDELSLEVEELIEEGKSIIRFFDQQKEIIINSGAREITLNGIKGLGCNASYMFGSDIAGELAKRSNTFGLSYYVASDGICHCSLRSRGKFNVAELAKLFGGGGHHGAAGFRISPVELHKMFI